jgi:phosphoglycerate dehydrogenase-like enzyme
VQVDGLSRGGAAREPFGRVFPAGQFAAAVQGARWLVLAAPLTEGTYHFLNPDRLAQCGGTYLINVGRGALAEEAALPDAIGKGWLSGAALDVFETEPLPDSSPFWHHPMVTLSPHCSGVTTTDGAGEGFMECLASVERGERSRWVVDREAGY